ncbi:protein AF1q [Hypomesus transpacificus]|uniref:protein AF1q n=1 Tax=Hypomesus transpacificus TaxID=137520 RepID=UPI001F07893D|nr:protein AF1q [Hypomesus transpacificus]XP_046875215.1 protein AF1q [Hypomesus transpacificus]XP_046875216.1 protein AF1q [Hypomesus transpacificus]
MLQKSNSQYDSFLYWRQPIPALDMSELEDLGLKDSKPANSNQAGKNKKEKKSSKMANQRKQKEEELPEYTTFNYWREPIASIDTLDFNLLL